MRSILIAAAVLVLAVAATNSAEAARFRLSDCPACTAAGGCEAAAGHCGPIRGPLRAVREGRPLRRAIRGVAAWRPLRAFRGRFAGRVLGGCRGCR